MSVMWLCRDKKITEDVLCGLCFVIWLFIYYFSHFLFVTEMYTCLRIILYFLFADWKGFYFFFGHPFPFSNLAIQKITKEPFGRTDSGQHSIAVNIGGQKSLLT